MGPPGGVGGEGTRSGLGELRSLRCGGRTPSSATKAGLADPAQVPGFVRVLPAACSVGPVAEPRPTLAIKVTQTRGPLGR